MNPFFKHRTELPERPLPSALYARTIDYLPGRDGYVLFDAVDAGWFDSELRHRGFITPSLWRELIEMAPIYAVEIAGDTEDNGAAAHWMNERREQPDDWLELKIFIEPAGPADLYDNIDGPPQRVGIDLLPIKPEKEKALRAATALTPSSDDDVKTAIPSATINRVVVLDVGQGSANAIYDDAGRIIAYVDLGAGVLKNAKTWPATLTGGFCFCFDPKVILTHWHYDHFHGANKFPAARGLTWIAPMQTLGPGPQSAMASHIARTGTLLVWGGAGALSAGALELERCTGPATDMNRDGIAVWAHGPGSADPILLPGDAHYDDVPSCKTARALTSMVVSHHGGHVGAASVPARPGGTATRLAFSYGDGNTYGHPLAKPVADLTGRGWLIGLPPPGLHADERVTCYFRPSGLGNILLEWPGGIHPARACAAAGCTATVDHHQ